MIFSQNWRNFYISLVLGKWECIGTFLALIYYDYSEITNGFGSEIIYTYVLDLLY